jgi:hypothetical protein
MAGCVHVQELAVIFSFLILSQCWCAPAQYEVVVEQLGQEERKDVREGCHITLELRRIRGHSLHRQPGKQAAAEAAAAAARRTGSC